MTTLGEQFEVAMEENRKLRAENERLRQALEETRHWIVCSGVRDPSIVINRWIDPALHQ